MPILTPPEGPPHLFSRRLSGSICIALGLFLILASFSGSWGQVYGQTVVTPTPGFEYADLWISKTADPICCEPGETVVFTIIVTNRGTGNATNVFISDTLPVELTLVEVITSKGTVGIVGNHFEVFVGTVAPGEIVTIVVTAVVGVDVPVDIIVTNTVYLEASELADPLEASADVMIKAVCDTPSELPDTGGPIPEEQGGTSLWLLLAGLLFLLLGVVLTLRGRARSSPEKT